MFGVVENINWGGGGVDVEGAGLLHNKWLTNAYMMSTFHCVFVTGFMLALNTTSLRRVLKSGRAGDRRFLTLHLASTSFLSYIDRQCLYSFRNSVTYLYNNVVQAVSSSPKFDIVNCCS